MVLVSTAALASNSRGHMMVSAVAWEQLEESTQEPVIELLKLSPNYTDWIRGVAEADPRQDGVYEGCDVAGLHPGYREEANSRGIGRLRCRWQR
jgi:hypothetical protein